MTKIVYNVHAWSISAQRSFLPGDVFDVDWTPEQLKAAVDLGHVSVVEPNPVSKGPVPVTKEASSGSNG